MWDATERRENNGIFSKIQNRVCHRFPILLQKKKYLKRSNMRRMLTLVKSITTLNNNICAWCFNYPRTFSSSKQKVLFNIFIRFVFDVDYQEVRQSFSARQDRPSLPPS